ncbi:hypothetical protein BDV98DRAFT_276814 [Pterulicium gracile]|uniref:Uncharacterized protein n=1 Tax=Pterulicium gracile TaxID=1884261 RepID=A0A5C3Q9X9_9AGAR|nr:hypothetical protein BDV98DRAFT_276814 [Pterula gracilis]
MRTQSSFTSLCFVECLQCADYGGIVSPETLLKLPSFEFARDSDLLQATLEARCCHSTSLVTVENRIEDIEVRYIA